MKYINIIDFNGNEVEYMIEMARRQRYAEQEKRRCAEQERQNLLKTLKPNKSKYFGNQPSVPRKKRINHG